VLHTFADGRIEDTGPLTTKRMETIDEEIHTAAMDFVDRQVKADTPFFHFKGETDQAPRKEIYYFGQGGELNAIRVGNWKIHFATIVGNIATGVRQTPGWPLIINLRADPYEKMWKEGELGYFRWYADNLWTFVPAQEYIRKFLDTIPGYPFQEGSSLNAAGINYQTLKAAQVLKQLETLSSPVN
jgi:hypothetical protein